MERHNIIKNLDAFVEIFKVKTVELFEQISMKHLNNVELLSLQEELFKTKREKEEIEKIYK